MLEIVSRLTKAVTATTATGTTKASVVQDSFDHGPAMRSRGPRSTVVSPRAIQFVERPE
jgi:hypothetical protein